MFQRISQKRFTTSYLCIASLTIGLTLGVLLPSGTRRTTPAPTPTPEPTLPTPIVSPDASFESAVSKAIVDTAAIENVTAWHADHDAHAIVGLSHRRRALERRTVLIVDQGTRHAGQAFLAAITSGEEDENGQTRFEVDVKKIAAIDPEKLKRWAAIALTILEIAEPFVPPPYNLAVHAAVMLLKLYLANQDPKPQQIFGDYSVSIRLPLFERFRRCDQFALAC